MKKKDIKKSFRFIYCKRFLIEKKCILTVNKKTALAFGIME